MPNNTASTFAADRLKYIQKKTLRLTQKQLVAYQFAGKANLPEGNGVTYTATRFERLPLPYAPLSEGVPPSGEVMQITQVSATAQQWGDRVNITDVAQLTIFHKPFQQAIRLCSLQIAETCERNTYLALMGSPNVNYVNSRGARGSLTAGDVLDPHTVNRTATALRTNGAPMFGGPSEDDTKIDAGKGGANASSSPRGRPHYVAIVHPNVTGDFSENATVVNAWTYSDINRLYNYEIGEWRSIRFCESNMVPSWTGQSQSSGTAGTSGSLAGAPTNYYIVVTGTDTQNQFESQIYSISAAISVTGPNGSISVTTPNVPGYTYSVYVGTSSTMPSNLGLSASGPTSGPLAGQATQLPANTAVVITALGAARTPPAYPGNTSGITVYPTFVFGEDAYTQVELDGLKMQYLDKADKSDPNNQLRVVSWTMFWGTLLENVKFMARIESASAFSATYG
jgi:N4-gp56 family major capsid protein